MAQESAPDPAIEWMRRFPYGEQDENGVDLSLIRERLRLSPAERLRDGDRFRRDALKILEYGRLAREKRS